MWKCTFIGLSACLLLQAVAGVPAIRRSKRQQAYAEQSFGPSLDSHSPPAVPSRTYGDVLPIRGSPRDPGPLIVSSHESFPRGEVSLPGNQRPATAGYTNGANTAYRRPSQSLLQLASLPGLTGPVGGREGSNQPGPRQQQQQQPTYAPVAFQQQTYGSTPGFLTGQPALSELRVVQTPNVQSRYSVESLGPAPTPIPRPSFSPDTNIQSNFISAPEPEQSYAAQPDSLTNFPPGAQNLPPHPTAPPSPVPSRSFPQLERPIAHSPSEQRPGGTPQQRYRTAFETLSGAARAAQLQRNSVYEGGDQQLQRNNQQPEVYNPQLQLNNQQPEAYNPAAYMEDPARYEYQWGVKNADGADYGHREARSGDLTQGSFYVLLPDTRRQTVSYRVDGQSGFIADVRYEGEAQFPTRDEGQGGYRAPGQRRPASSQQLSELRTQSGSQGYAPQEDGYQLQGQELNGYQPQGQNQNGYQSPAQSQNGYEIQSQEQNGYQPQNQNQNGYQLQETEQTGYQLQGQQLNGQQYQGQNQNSYKIQGQEQEQNDFELQEPEQNGYQLQSGQQNGYQIQSQNGYQSQKNGYQPQAQEQNDYQLQGQEQNGYNAVGQQQTGYRPPPQTQTQYQSPDQLQLNYQTQGLEQTGYQSERPRQPAYQPSTDYQPQGQQESQYQTQPQQPEYQSETQIQAGYQQSQFQSQLGYQAR